MTWRDVTAEWAIVLGLAALLWFLWRWLKRWGQRETERRYRAEDLAAGYELLGQTDVPLDDTPDGPLAFGYKAGWLAVRCSDPEQVVAVLDLRNRQRANWATGLARSGNPGQVLVSPALNGFVLVIGLWEDDLEDAPGRTERLICTFPEVQFFESHRVTDYYHYSKYVDGKCIRKRCIEESRTLCDIGPLTPEEFALGQTRRDNEVCLDEEDVLDIAAAWGVDPRFESISYPPSVGWVCEL